jgi:indoleamine 2,3-dioxygenase
VSAAAVGADDSIHVAQSDSAENNPTKRPPTHRKQGKDIISHWQGRIDCDRSMIGQRLRLEDFGLSRKTGFLPSDPPITRLPQKYYKPWETVMDSFNALLLAGRLQDVVDDLPVLETRHLRNDTERRRAFLVLSFLAHGYVWGDAVVPAILPASVAMPFDQIARELEIRPVCSHASLCLWNWKPIFACESPSLENLATMHTFTGSTDESWFYLISTAMEIRGAPTLQLALDAIEAIDANSIGTLTFKLRALAMHLDDMAVALGRMHEKCDPHIFYHKIRPFLAGWKNMADAGLKQGLIYEGCEDTPEGSFRTYSGGSNAQSALIHMLDIALGVVHEETGQKTSMPGSRRNEFMQDMRNYMPANHRRFLEALDRVANIRTYCQQHRTDLELSEAYDACLAMLKVFRDKHLAIVSRYIVIPAAAAQKTDTLASKGLAKVAFRKKEDLKGTGGTNLMAFLKQSRDETGKLVLSNWARQLMQHCYGEVDLQQADQRALVGLAGSWGNEWTDIDGGLCQ